MSGRCLVCLHTALATDCLAITPDVLPQVEVMVPSHRLTDDGDQGTQSRVHTLGHLMVIIHETGRLFRTRLRCNIHIGC